MNTMRMIDADTLDIAKEVETACKALGFREKSAFEGFVTGWLTGAIAKAPTIAAVPVVRGEWVEAKSGVMSVYPPGQVMCSVCKQWMPSQWKKMPPYCYGCGAKMEVK